MRRSSISTSAGSSRKISSLMSQLGLRQGEPDREEQIICGCNVKEGEGEEGEGRKRHDDGRLCDDRQTEEGRGNNLANLDGVGTVERADNIRMRIGGFERGRAGFLTLE